MSPAFDEAAGFSNEFGGVLGKAGAEQVVCATVARSAD